MLISTSTVVGRELLTILLMSLLAIPMSLLVVVVGCPSLVTNILNGVLLSSYVQERFTGVVYMVLSGVVFLTLVWLIRETSVTLA